MSFKEILHRIFPGALREKDYVEKTKTALSLHGFNAENTIACVSVCRDEITQPFIALIRDSWGEAFNLSSLAGMFFAGWTGLSAAMHHSPNIDGWERYVLYAFPHIAISGEGTLGTCTRAGRKGESHACGALIAFLQELTVGQPDLSLDYDDIEQSLLKARLAKEIPLDTIRNLLDLTLTTQKVIQNDIQRALDTVVDNTRSDYALFTGIQIHGPDSNYIFPVSSYAVIKTDQVMIDL